TKAKNFFGTALAEAINIPRNTLNAMNHDLEQLGISIESVIAKSAKVPDLFKGQSRDQITPHRLSADEEKAVVEELNHIRKAHDEADKATDKHAQAVKALFEAYSGKTALDEAKTALEALAKAGGDVTRMTLEQQTSVNTILQKALDTYRALG